VAGELERRASIGRIAAVMRLLVRLTARDLKGLSSIGLNNLFFVVVLVMQGSRSPASALWAASPFLLMLGVPLLLTMSDGPLKLLPAARRSLLPLTRNEWIAVRVLSLGLSPALWIAVLLLLLRAGAGVAALACGAVAALQAGSGGIKTLAATLPKRGGRRSLAWPRPPGRWGRVVRLNLL